MLYLNGVTYRIGSRTLLDEATAHVPAGHRIGFIGRNGSGKSTLLRLIVGENELDGGSIRVQSKARVGMIAQDPPGGSQTPLNAVLDADKERNQLLAELESNPNPERIAEIHSRLTDIDAHAAPARAASILAGLGFEEKRQHDPLSSFSGGLRMRVALAQVLFARPELLLLDEPTNHLDLESVMWLENYLRDYPYTVIIVSHDRDLLSSVVDRILHLERGKLSMYTGKYDDFEKVRLQKMALAEATRVKQETERKHIQSFVDRFKAKASKARQAQSRIKALERMAPIASLTHDRQISFNFPQAPRCASPLVKIEEGAVGYTKGQPILKDLHLSIFNEDRIALLGANGNGKTTLARLVAGHLTCETGRVMRTSKLKVGYFTQDQLERLERNLTALEQMAQKMPDAPPVEVRKWLGRFGFEQEKAEVKTEGLSGGERTRLVLALIAKEQPNLLILDEPTNHLDMDSRSALIEGLNEYDGTVLLISHNRHLIETTADQLWVVGDGGVEIYREDLNEYRKSLLDARSSRKRAESGDPDEKVSRRDQRRESANRRALVAPLKKEADAAEARLEKLTSEKEGIDEELGRPETYTKDATHIATLSKRQKELAAEIEITEEKWLEAQARLEEAEENTT